jgi:hypothetical protein
MKKGVFDFMPPYTCNATKTSHLYGGGTENMLFMLSLISSMIAAAGALSGCVSLFQALFPKQFPLVIEKLTGFITAHFMMFTFLAFLGYGFFNPSQAYIYFKKGQAFFSSSNFGVIVSITLVIILYWMRKLQVKWQSASSNPGTKHSSHK